MVLPVLPPRLQLIRAARLLALMVLLVGIARSGARYFHCAMMGVVLADACCASHDPHDDEPAATSPDCCESRTADTLPSASTTSTSELPALACTGVVASSTVSVLFGARPAAVAYEARAGPPTNAERRAAIMIWNC
jgi:hypothetical protein